MNGIFQITGGKRLHGEITPQGAKNEALQIICAVLLTDETSRFRDAPRSHVGALWRSLHANSRWR